MNRIVLGLSVLLASASAFAQVITTDTTTNQALNSAQNIINSDKTISIGGYGQIDYNQEMKQDVRSNGNLDVHRLVLFFGYRFSEKVQFVTEIEFEHVFEVGVEQAFINYNITKGFNLRAGLMLIPMGIVNEYHESTTYNGVERPELDSKIVPSTWREMGAGFAGNIDNISLKYQVYAVNGFLGYNGAGAFRGSDGLRKGRQKGAESTMSSPNLAAKVDFYGIKGLKLGAAGYFGNSQSTLYDDLPSSDTLNLGAMADSSVIGVSMLGLDARYQYKAFEARAQFIHATLSNSDEYNKLTGSDVGSSMMGYYGEMGYDLVSIFNKKAKQRLVLFGRYEFYDTHNSVAGDLVKNDAYARTDITMGLTYHIANGAALKGDFQIRDNNAKGSDPYNQLNLGVAFWF
ncbi:MAG: hypothetical protein KDD41_11500 [Flavobacteriales bacterium]|nr:hypothetical protein [Flavobacteriales bacterium]